VSEPITDLFADLQAVLQPQYRLERELGRGGMGVVFRAVDLALDRRVAVKAAHPELAAQPTIAERFLAEARMLARIRHPNIVTVHNAGNVSGLLYYVMDEIPGESLRQRLNRDGLLDPADTQALMGDIAAALANGGQSIDRKFITSGVVKRTGKSRIFAMQWRFRWLPLTQYCKE